MEIVELVWGAVVIFGCVALAAITWAVIWQLRKISRISREKRILARKVSECEKLENDIRSNLLSQGFSASEARDAVRSSRVQRDSDDSPDTVS